MDSRCERIIICIKRSGVNPLADTLVVHDAPPHVTTRRDRGIAPVRPAAAEPG